MKTWNWKAIVGLAFTKFVVGQLGAWFALLCVNIVLWLRKPYMSEPVYNSSTPHLLAVIIMGLLINGSFGYLIAMLAPRKKMAHACWMAFLALLLGLLSTSHIRASDFPGWFIFMGWLNLAALPAGAWWRIRTHGRETQIVLKAGPANSTSTTPAPIASPHS